MKHDDSTPGKVTEYLPGFKYLVKTDKRSVICYPSGKMRLNRIRVGPGDKVAIALSPTGDRGIIMRRL